MYHAIMTTIQAVRASLLFLLAVLIPGQGGVGQAKTQDDFFKALGEVESNNNDAAVGDGGAAIGRYQIHKSYWKDATTFDPTLGGSYEDCKGEAYARRVMLAYFRRYAKTALDGNDWQTLARIHNGGPRIMSKPSDSKAWKNTTAYWEKVKKAMGL